MDAGFDPNFPVDHLSAGGAFCLIADKEDVIGRIFQAIFQMIDNPSTGAHAAAGDDDGRAVDVEQFFMVLISLYRIQALKIKGMIALCLECPGLFIPKCFQRRIDPGDGQPQGGIDEHRDIRLDPVQLVQQFLGSAERKSGNIDDAFIGQGSCPAVCAEPRFGVFDPDAGDCRRWTP